jgi:hypothetical protein
MSDADQDDFTDFADPDGPGTGRADAGDQDHPEQEAHGGSMAPGLVDDAGDQVAEPPPASPDRG